MDLDPVDTTLFIFNKTEHTKMHNNDINESDSEKIVEVVGIESIQDNEIEAKDIFVKAAKQLTHIENSVETTTSIDHDETDVEEEEKVTEKENTLEPTEEVEKCVYLI